MKMSYPFWRIWIDTGGTFTDCLAYDPDGNLHRVKVLSSSALRGKLLQPIDEKTFQAAFHWPVSKDIFQQYTFRLSNQSHPDIQVEQVDLQQKTITLTSALPTQQQPADFEITTGEEAPVLAARVVTQTPLTQPLPPMHMRLGSTKGTNAMLERKGARTALLLTQGFRDLLAIDTQQRPDIFSLHIVKPQPYYATVIEVKERLNAQGEILLPLSDTEIKKIIDQLRKAEVEAVAVALLHSYVNPIHEQQLGQALTEAGFSFVSCSAALTPSIKILPRAKTALVNAYLAPIIDNYLKAVNGKLSHGSLKVMTSAGGLVDATLFHPKDSLLSGPAGGVVGAAHIMRQVQQQHPDIQQILAFDMGGTSTDVSRYAGEFDYKFETRVGAIDLFSPTLAIETVAAGGGSVCYFDGYRFSVGPESAGAYPGPACYGFGGPLTITDVNLLLGRLQEQSFGIPISKEKARQALADLTKQLLEKKGKDYPEEEILLGFLRIANEKMTEAIRKISVRKGYDPQEHALLAFGGAGGQHACQIAELLGIDTLIIPYDAGLLSAFGMGQAVVERMVSQQVLLPLSEAQAVLEERVAMLQQEARYKLQQEGYEEEELHIRFTRLYLRFAGQDATLEVDYSPDTGIQQHFREQYEAQYGHWLEDQTIELESIKVMASTKPARIQTEEAPLKNYLPAATAQQPCWVQDQWQTVSIYEWEQLKPGASIGGPALITSQNSTTYVAKSWRFSLDHHNNALVQQTAQPTSSDSIHLKSEEVQLELFTNRFGAVAEEMGALLERTAFSVNVKERLDFSCALLDAQGELVVNAPHIPVHLGSLGICVRAVKSILTMEEGDVVITNHPKYGGSHLPDITLISPVFYQKKLVGYVANRAHHAEIGGKRPGSMPPDAKCLAEEGVVISPTYLVKKGNPQWKAVRAIFQEAPYPTRALQENLADLNGALASLQLGSDSVQKLCQRFSIEAVQHYMALLKRFATDSLSESLSSFQEEVYQAQEKLDDGTPLQVCFHIRDNRVDIDFQGSGEVHPGNLNATQAIVNSAVIYVLRLLIRQPIPLNEGMMENVKIHLPHSLLNPPFPDDPFQCPAVVGGNTETSQRLVDTLLKALRIVACSQGTMNNLLFGDDTFGYYETIGGGSGAGPGFHGAHAVHQHMTNTRITDPEILEFRYPVRLEIFAIRPHSGGQGQWNGGHGIIRQITFLRPVALTILSQHRREVPYGLAGGAPGATGEQYILRKGGKKTALKGVDQANLSIGDSIVVKTPGGGGYGSG